MAHLKKSIVVQILNLSDFLSGLCSFAPFISTLLTSFLHPWADVMDKFQCRQLCHTEIKNFDCWAVVATQLVERLLPTSEVRGSNPVIGKIYIEQFSQFCMRNFELGKIQYPNWPSVQVSWQILVVVPKWTNMKK